MKRQYSNINYFKLYNLDRFVRFHIARAVRYKLYYQVIAMINLQLQKKKEQNKTTISKNKTKLCGFKAQIE